MSIYLKTILDIIGTVLTAFSIFWGIHVYKKTSDASAFAELRTSLIDMQRTLSSEKFKRLLSDESFSETGISVSNQVRNLFDKPKFSSEYIFKFLSSVKKENIHVYNCCFTAISVGLYNSNARKEAREVIENLSKIPLRFESQVPLISEILNGFLLYIISSIEFAADALSYTEGINTDMKTLKDFLKNDDNKELEDDEHKEFIFRAIAETFRNSSVDYKERVSGKVIFASQGILNILIHIILNKSDKEMRKLREKATKLYSVKYPDEPVPLIIDKTFFYLELLKDEFDTHQWDSIVAAKNEIRKTAHGSEY